MQKKLINYAVSAALITIGAGLCSAAYAEITYEESADGKTLTVTVPSGEYISKTQADAKQFSSYEKIVINKTVAKDDDYAVSGYSNMRLDMPNTDLEINMLGNTRYSNADAIKGKNWGTYINVRNLTIRQAGPISDAFNPDHGGTPQPSTIYGNLTLEIDGGNGIRSNASVVNANQTTSLTVKGKTSIWMKKPSHGQNAYPSAVYAGDSHIYKSKGVGLIYLEGDSHITIDADNTNAIFAGKNGHIEVANLTVDGSGQQATGITANYNANIAYGTFDFAANAHGTSVTLTGDEYIFDLTKGTKDPKDPASDGTDNSKAFFASGNDGADKYAIISAKDDKAISLKATGDIAAEDGGWIRLNTTAQSSVDGNIFTKTKGGISLNFGEGSTYTGQISAEGEGSLTEVTFAGNARVLGSAMLDDEGKGVVKLDMGQGGEWHLSDNSTLTTLKAEGTLIDLSAAGQTNASTLTVTDGFSGSGTLRLDLDAANKGNREASETSDYVLFTGTNNTGTLSLDISGDSNLKGLESQDKLYFSSVAGGSLTFASGSDITISSPASVYDYKLGVGSETDADGTHWFLSGGTKVPGANSNVSRAVVSSAYYLLSDLDWMNKRKGDARYGSTSDGLWVRTRYERARHDDQYRTRGSMLQIGFELEKALESGQYQYGASYDYIQQHTDVAGFSGNGDLQSYGFSLYGTYTGNNGWYQDTVLRLGKVFSDWDLDRFHTDDSQWYGSISLEGGRHIPLSETWYVEPQLQVQFSQMAESSFTTNYGVRTDQDSIRSTIGRAGVRLGREWTDAASGRQNTLYVRGDVIREFSGRMRYTLSGSDGTLSHSESASGTWFNLGVGTDVSLGENAKLWADVNRQFGHAFDAAWQINAGLLWKF